MSVHLVRSERGQDHVFLNGFTFRKAYFHSTVGCWKWRCTNKKCTASIYLDNELTVMAGSSLAHNHAPVSRKRSHLKELTMMDGAVTTPTSAANISSSDHAAELASALTESLQNNATVSTVRRRAGQKPRRGRGAGGRGATRTAVGRKRQRNPPRLDGIHHGSHLLVDDNEFPLDQCDSNIVFVHDFENQLTDTDVGRGRAAPAADTSGGDAVVVDDQHLESYDPLSQTLGGTAFAAVCDLSSRPELVYVKAESTSTLPDENEELAAGAAAGHCPDDCFLFDEVGPGCRHLPPIPSPDFIRLPKSAASSAIARRRLKGRPASLQGSLDLSHPIDTFFLAMAQSVKCLSPRNQIKAKQMISSLVTQMEMDEAS